MIYTEQTKKAMVIAYNAHHGQLDKCGIPYIYHPIHSDISRLQNPTEKDWKRKEKYEKAMQILLEDCES